MNHDTSHQGLAAAESHSATSVLNQEQTPIVGYLQHKSFIKLFLLNLLTLNVYRFYWYYENWDAIRTSERRDIFPFWRSLFRWFYVHTLFKKIYQSTKQQGYKAEVRYSLFATLIIVLGIVSYVVERLIEKHGASLKNVSLFLCLWLISDLLFWPIQRLINFYSAKLAQTPINLNIHIHSPNKYFEVSLVRFVIMNILTFSWYFEYWQYKNWQAIKKVDQSAMWPFWRAIFSGFFIHVLFKRITISAKNQGYSKSIPYLILAASRIYIILFFTFLLSIANSLKVDEERTIVKWIIVLLLAMIYRIFVLLADFCAFMPFQKAISFYNVKAATVYQPRKGFTGGEIVLAILGIVLWSGILLSTYLYLK